VAGAVTSPEHCKKTPKETLWQKLKSHL